LQTQCDESLGVKGKEKKAIASNAMWWKLRSDRKNKKAITTNATQKKKQSSWEENDGKVTKKEL
jgi:hypothetical protein